MDKAIMMNILVFIVFVIWTAVVHRYTFNRAYTWATRERESYDYDKGYEDGTINGVKITGERLGIKIEVINLNEEDK